jgi:hypothetical protein
LEEARMQFMDGHLRQAGPVKTQNFTSIGASKSKKKASSLV